MQFREFYNYGSHNEEPEFLEGRWKCKASALWNKDEPNGLYHIEWTDLFGQ
jgi:hypothetical protein